MLPVCCLDRVMDAEKPEEEAEAAECNILAGALGGNGKRRYRILLHKEASEEKLLLPADDIIDLREINDEQILELTEPVLNERNRYLIAVAVTETGKREEGFPHTSWIRPACQENNRRIGEKELNIYKPTGMNKGTAGELWNT